MTQGSPDGLEPAEQARLTKQLGRALVQAAGEGWQRVWAQYRSAGKHVEADFVVTGPDGRQRPVRPPEAAIELFAKLRGGMYRPERGTWLAATYSIEPTGGYEVDFEPDAEPAWRRVPPPIGFQDELRWFPRADEAIPEWLRVRAGISPTPATGVPVTPVQPGAGPDAPGQNAPGQSGPVPSGPGQNSPGPNGFVPNGPGQAGPGAGRPGQAGPGFGGAGPNGPGAAAPGPGFPSGPRPPMPPQR